MNNNKFWLGVFAGTILVLLLCCCCSILSVVILWSNPEIKAAFSRGYCGELALQGAPLSSDFLGLCR